MQQERIAVGSKRGPKLEAAHEALKQFAHLLDSEALFEVQGFEVESGVGHTPSSSSESMLGARQRAEALLRMAKEKGESFRYYVGLEGGLEVFEPGAETGSAAAGDSRRVFLES